MLFRSPQACGPLGAANPKSVSQADCSRRETHCSFTASLVLGSLDEETSFTVYEIGCGVDALLGYGWLALQFLYEEGQVSMCEKACSSASWVWARPCSSLAHPCVAPYPLVIGRPRQ